MSWPHEFRAEKALLNRLAEGIASIDDHFDVVILDPPPALGTISLSVMRAANALLVPIPPTVIDFTSTISFFAMLHETMGALEERGLPSADLARGGDARSRVCGSSPMPDLGWAQS